MLQTAVAILFIHFIGDFLFQSTNMAVNKAVSLKWLFIHVATYTLVLYLGSGILLGFVVAVQYSLVNGGLHLVTDFFTSKMNARLNKREDKRWFFCGIGFDQFIHAASLLLTYDYLILT